MVCFIDSKEYKNGNVNSIIEYKYETDVTDLVFHKIELSIVKIQNEKEHVNGHTSTTMVSIKYEKTDNVIDPISIFKNGTIKFSEGEENCVMNLLFNFMQILFKFYKIVPDITKDDEEQYDKFIYGTIYHIVLKGYHISKLLHLASINIDMDRMGIDIKDNGKNIALYFNVSYKEKIAKFERIEKYTDSEKVPNITDLESKNYLCIIFNVFIIFLYAMTILKFSADDPVLIKYKFINNTNYDFKECNINEEIKNNCKCTITDEEIAYSNK
jgi:hypothetical protein